MAYAWDYDLSVSDILQKYASVIRDQRLAHQAFVFDMVWPWLMYLVEPERWTNSTPAQRREAFANGEWWVPGNDAICDQTGQPWDILGGEPVPPDKNAILRALELFFRSEWMETTIAPEECMRIARTLLIFGPQWLQEGQDYDSLRDLLIKPTIYRTLSSYAARLEKTNATRKQQRETLEIMRARGYDGPARRQYEELAASGAFDPIKPPSFDEIKKARENQDALHRIVYNPDIVAKMHLVSFMRDGLSGAASTYTITAHKIEDDIYVLRIVIPDPVLRQQFAATLGLNDDDKLTIRDPFDEQWIAAYRAYKSGDFQACRAILEEITIYVTQHPYDFNR